MKNKIALLSLALVGFNAVSIPLTQPALAFDQLLIQQFGIANITDNGNSGISKENISLPSLLGDRTVKIAQALSLRVQTKSIIAFNQLQGNTAWQQDIRNRILSSQWDFYSNGTFSYTQPNNTLSPIRGTYRVSNGTIYFTGSSSRQVGWVGLTVAQISGQLYTQNNQRLISMSYMSDSRTTANVNNTPFYGSSKSSYRFTASLK
jgi:hypothetical protein